MSSVTFSQPITCEAGATTSKKAFQIKGSGFTIPVFHVLNPDMDQLTAQLTKQVKQAASFFDNAPLVIDLNRLEESNPLDLTALVNLLRQLGLIPVGLSGGSAVQKKMAGSMKLALLTASGGKKVKASKLEPDSAPESEQEPELKSEPESEEPDDTVQEIPDEQTEQEKEKEKKEEKAEPVVAKMVDKPVRSGQSITAEQGDLIVTAPVSSGAEIMAPGNIHVYGVLRGRALAGIEGDENVSIFCQSLEADLVSIAGIYKVSEEFPAGVRSQPVRIRLRMGQLDFASIV